MSKNIPASQSTVKMDSAAKAQNSEKKPLTGHKAETVQNVSLGSNSHPNDPGKESRNLPAKT